MIAGNGSDAVNLNDGTGNDIAPIVGNGADQSINSSNIVLMGRGHKR
jgi:hypothetical protein